MIFWHPRCTKSMQKSWLQHTFLGYGAVNWFPCWKFASDGHTLILISLQSTHPKRELFTVELFSCTARVVLYCSTLTVVVPGLNGGAGMASCRLSPFAPPCERLSLSLPYCSSGIPQQLAVGFAGVGRFWKPPKAIEQIGAMLQPAGSRAGVWPLMLPAGICPRTTAKWQPGDVPQLCLIRAELSVPSGWGWRLSALCPLVPRALFSGCTAASEGLRWHIAPWESFVSRNQEPDESWVGSTAPNRKVTGIDRACGCRLGAGVGASRAQGFAVGQVLDLWDGAGGAVGRAWTAERKARAQPEQIPSLGIRIATGGLSSRRLPLRWQERCQLVRLSNWADVIRSSLWWPNWIMSISKSFAQCCWWILALHRAKQMRMLIQAALHPFSVLSAMHQITASAQQGILTLVGTSPSPFPLTGNLLSTPSLGVSEQSVAGTGAIHQVISWGVWKQMGKLFRLSGPGLFSAVDS